MGSSEFVFLILAVAGLSFYLVCHAARPGRMSSTALRRLRLDDRAFLETRRLLASFYVARFLSLSGSAVCFGIWLRLLGLGQPSACGLALAFGLATSLLLAPLMLRSRLSGDAASDLIARSLRSPLALSGALLEVLPGLSLRAARGVPHSTRPRAESARAGRAGGRTAGTAEEAGAPGPAAAPTQSPFGKDLLKLLLRLRERRISEVMVSRVDMVCAQDSSTISELAELVMESGHARVPVFKNTIDSITGYVTAKDVVLKLHKGSGADGASSILRKPVFVTPEASIERCLEQLQREHAALAVVADSAGRTLGLVTSEDILEEVVGDLYEDYEPEEPAYRILDDGTAQIRANVKVGDLREVFGVAPAVDHLLPLGQYVRGLLATEPVAGDSASDEVFLYRVTRMLGKAIWSLKVEKKDSAHYALGGSRDAEKGLDGRANGPEGPAIGPESDASGPDRPTAGPDAGRKT
ncbi:MAG: CBS domain-containing protein [Candidatus Eisenbacteria bacterium]|nr:CBS domain-containing protein [Candidatus Eisenbacteria bacterium]